MIRKTAGRKPRRFFCAGKIENYSDDRKLWKEKRNCDKIEFIMRNEEEGMWVL